MDNVLALVCGLLGVLLADQAVRRDKAEWTWLWGLVRLVFLCALLFNCIVMLALVLAKVF